MKQLTGAVLLTVVIATIVVWPLIEPDDPAGRSSDGELVSPGSGASVDPDSRSPGSPSPLSETPGHAESSTDAASSEPGSSGVEPSSADFSSAGAPPSSPSDPQGVRVPISEGTSVASDPAVPRVDRAALHGRVQDPDGNPIEGATVRWIPRDRTDRPHDARTWTRTTDESGSFAWGALSVVEGSLHARHPQHPSATRSGVIPGGPEIVLELPHGSRISGVLLERGEPIVDARITLRGSRESRSTRSGEDGSFRFIGLRPGSYTLRVASTAVSESEESGEGEAESPEEVDESNLRLELTDEPLDDLVWDISP